MPLLAEVTVLSLNPRFSKKRRAAEWPSVCTRTIIAQVTTFCRGGMQHLPARSNSNMPKPPARNSSSTPTYMITTVGWCRTNDMAATALRVVAVSSGYATTNV